jgi:hypothetical protein
MTQRQLSKITAVTMNGDVCRTPILAFDFRFK